MATLPLRCEWRPCGRFSDRSDIDLAVDGIPPAACFRAWAEAGASCPFELDLVERSDDRVHMAP